MHETNRERLKRLGITYEKAFASLEEDELCRFCPGEQALENRDTTRSICEDGFCCDCAFQDWLDAEAD